MMDIEIKEIENTRSKKIVGTQITQELYEKLKKQSEEDFMSISDVLRKIIFLYYKSKENE